MVRLWTILLISGAVACFLAWAGLALREAGLSSLQGVRRTFRGHSKYGKAVLGFVFCGLFVLCATKPQAGGNGDPGSGDGGNPGGGTNGVQNVGGEMGGSNGVQNVGGDALTGLTGLTGYGDGGGQGVPALPVANSQLPTSSGAFSADDLARGFVFVGAVTNGTAGFDPPSGAVVCGDWLSHGAAYDRMYAAFGDWAMRIGTNWFESVRAFSFGRVDPLPPATNRWFAPLCANFGVVPAANWQLLGNGEQGTGNGSESQFWHAITPSNTLLMTWRDVLLDRDVSKPLSFQIEVAPEGAFEYRYDFSRLGVEEVSNILVGASLGTLDWTTNALPTNLTSLSFHRLLPEDAVDPDRDGDGVLTSDEIFVHGTDPGLVDTDGDGIPDGVEVAAGTNPCERDVPDAEILERVASSATNEAFASSEIVITNSLIAWKLWDGFAADIPAGATNLIYERTISVNRTSGWQQFFLSSEPDRACGWGLEGMRLEWEDCDGWNGVLRTSPPGDSAHLAISTNYPSSLSLRLVAESGSVRCAKPVYLLAYAPTVKFMGGREVDIGGDLTATVYLDGADSDMRYEVDRSARPCLAALYPQETSPALFDEFADMSLGWLSFSGTAYGGKVAAGRPGDYELPQIAVGGGDGIARGRSGIRAYAPWGGHLVVLDPSVAWGCRNSGCAMLDGLGYGWVEDSYFEEDPYPLDTKCLRSDWSRDVGGDVLDWMCELNVTSGIGDGEGGLVTTSADGDMGKVFVGGTMVWAGTSDHVHDAYCDGGHDEGLGDGCSSCDGGGCENGNCDSLEGSSLGSLRFRIPLGELSKGHIAGFVWFSTDEPTYVSQWMFQTLPHPDASVDDSFDQSWNRRIVCSGQRGRDLQIEDIQYGVRVTVREHATQTLEHTWEIVNVDGSASQVRLRKISRLNNVMSDETYTYTNGCWTRLDNISGLVTSQYSWDDFGDQGGGTKHESRTTYDAEGNTVESVETEWTRIGEFDNAVLRETYRSESSGQTWKWSCADYWNDPSRSSRHGRRRLVWGNARAWEYTDFDGQGRETLKVEQRGNAEVPADFPYVESNELHNVSTLSDAFVTVRGYGPDALDAGHPDDSAKPRSETRYVVEGGVARMIGRSWMRYTRLTRGGYDAVKRETWRALGMGVQPEGSGCAYSYEIAYADAGEGTPLLMRNAVAEAMDEDGVLTVNSHSVSDGVLHCTSRRFFGANELPAYEMTETDATYGTALRRTVRLADGDAVIADEQSVYDGKNRLRSTSYLDGTDITNAYSCCRLLWKRDREGRKTLRSAQTGTDHLYNAMEEVWLGDVSTNGAHLVTQHFYDGVGRETNTVTCVGSMPGASITPEGGNVTVVSATATAYPEGGNDLEVRMDARGKVTQRRTEILGNFTETGESVFTNGVEVSRTKSRSHFGGGSSVRREWGGFNWTEERRFDEYDQDGRRVAYVVTESPDYGTVTNSITTYDLLGRIESVATPTGRTGVPPVSGWSVIFNAYDGTTSRILTSTYTAGDVVRTTTYLYNEFGEQVGTVLDGITNRTDITYEQFSNEWWKVETAAVIGPHTNSLTITRTQLTGLSDSCRRHTIEMVGRCAPTPPPGGSPSSATVTETIATYNPGTKIETETVTSSIAPTVTRRRMYGLLLSAETEGTTTYNSYDALGRVAATSRTIGEGEPLPLQSFSYSHAGDLIATHTYTNGTDIITETYAYDILGNRIATTDALGNTTYRTYDPLGNVITEDGATYPVRYAYDTAGRRTSLSTTRDGVTWDTTTWTYDPCTSLCTSKTYADNSTVTYTYTPDNLLLRTTYASGRWKENVYDERRKVVAVEYSDGETVSLAYDAFLNEIAFSNDVAAANLDRDAKGNCTNDTVAVGNESKTTRCTFDAFRRLTGIDGTIYDYNADGLLASISNDISLVEYAYTPDRLDAGYSLTLSNGVVFTRSLVRDGYRRSLVTGISSVANGVGAGSLAYTYDTLNRPTSRNNDTFGYNARGEVVFSRRGAENAEESYSYDDIGNLLHSAFNTATNTYTANNLNQYTSVLCASAPLRDISHDADGNMLSDGNLSFTYDAVNRLKTVSSNGVLLVTNFYDAKSRRVKKVTPEATTTFFYDDWNLIEERIAYTNGTTTTIRYFWGKDLSGTLQGAGGVGGLLYLTIDGVPYVPNYDNIGNITRYLDANGNTVAQYTYDAFGGTLSQSGSLASFFRHRFSTKYIDVETGFYYYGYRFYRPDLGRWLNRDPIGEDGGINLYGFCQNSLPYKVDFLGKIECCNCAYSGNLLTSGQSTGFSTLDRKKCFYLSEGWIIDVIEDYPCLPKYHSAIGDCFAKSCRVTTRYRCQRSQSISDPTKSAYFWAYISDEVQPCATRSR